MAKVTKETVERVREERRNGKIHNITKVEPALDDRTTRIIRDSKKALHELKEELKRV